MFEVRSKDSSAELGDIRNDETRSELCPTYKLGRFWIDNHSGTRRSEPTVATRKRNSLLVELGDKIIGCDRFSAERARLRHGLQRVILAATVAPTVGGASGDSVSVGYVHFVVNGAIRCMDVQVASLVEIVLQHGCISGKAAFSGDGLLVRGGRTRAI